MVVDDDDPVCPLVEKPEKDPLQLVWTSKRARSRRPRLLMIDEERK